jgi:hypothetical protein
METALVLCKRPQDTLISKSWFVPKRIQYAPHAEGRLSSDPIVLEDPTEPNQIDLVYQVHDQKTNQCLKRFVFCLKDIRVPYLASIWDIDSWAYYSWDDQVRASSMLIGMSQDQLRQMPLYQSSAEMTVGHVEETCLEHLKSKVLPDLETHSDPECEAVGLALTRVGVHRVLVSALDPFAEDEKNDVEKP